MRRVARALLAALAVVGAGCREADARDQVTVRFWALGREGEVVQQLVPEFERRHPGVRVRVQQIPWTAAHEKLLTAFVGDATPDLAQLGNTWIPEFAALGALEPLDAYVARSRALRPADYFPGIWATNVVDGRTYGLPWYVDTRAMFYRTDLLRRAGYDRAPTTWADWATAMRRVKALGGATEYGALLPLDEWAQPVIMGLQAGSPLLADGGRRGAFRDSTFRRAFAAYVALFREGLAPAVANTQISNLYQEMARGRFAFYVSGPWNIGEFRRRMPAALQGSWATAPLPGPTGAASGVSIAGGASVVLFRRGANKDAAWRFAEYLAEPAQQLRFYALTGDLPARTAAWRDTLLANDPYARAFGEQLTRAVPLPPVPEWELIAARVAQYAEQAARGRMTEDAALTALDREVDGILEKRRWMLARRGGRARVSARVASVPRAGWWFVAPALALIVVFFLLPVVASLLLSFTDFDIYAVADVSNTRWVGLRNYGALLQNPLFWTAVRNTFYFALVGGPLTVATSLGAALLLNARAVRFKALFRTIYFLPFVTTLVAVAVVWRYLYHPRYGLLNYALARVGIGPIDWLGDPRWAMPAIILMAVWKNFGYNMLICIAGLQRIPEELYEAAALDGATGWQRFVHVTLPRLGPTLVFVAVVTMIGYFQLFAEPYVMTQGGPLRSTTSVVLLMYEEGFRWWRMGSAAAVAFLLFAVIGVGTLAQRAVQRRTEGA